MWVSTRRGYTGGTDGLAPPPPPPSLLKKGKGKERKGKERKGKERKGKEGQESKGKGRKGREGKKEGLKTRVRNGPIRALHLSVNKALVQLAMPRDKGRFLVRTSPKSYFRPI